MRLVAWFGYCLSLLLLFPVLIRLFTTWWEWVMSW